MEKKFLVNSIRLISTPEQAAEPYSFEATRFTRNYVNFRLRSTRKFRGYLFEKGRISEEIQRYLLASTGMWQEVADHPFEEGKSETRRLGPDSLQRSTLSNELFYFEFTWWDNSERAIVHATQQVIRDYQKRPFHHQEPVKGAYFAWLDWNGGRYGRLFVNLTRLRLKQLMKRSLA